MIAMKLCWLIACAVLVYGCQSNPQETIPLDLVKEHQKQPALPYWVISPPDTGEFVVAIVPRNDSTSDYDLQLKVAILEARAQLAKNRSSYISDETYFVSKRGIEGSKSSFENLGTHRSSLALNFRNAQVAEEYISPEGDLYILYGFP
ncbi:hypothetical protein OAH87_06045 [Marinomonas sp.]|nr:hypothetical protein [Marinomonas sp.]MDB4838012.1 hypothetical protein [Marinomonas sp.]